MMKKYIIITLVLVANAFLSCEDPLERGAVGILSENEVWKSENLTNLYVANLYARTELYPGGNSDNVHKLVLDGCAAGYCRTFGPWPFGYRFTQGLFSNQGTDPVDINGYWKYDLVRDINEGIERLSAETNPFDEAFTETRLGELHFLRAWAYFQMVKRYGGVPLITEVQSIDTPITDLSVARSSEQEIYDFIASETDLSAQYLDGKTVEYGRITYWAALALKSRTMMYAGSVGEFGTMQLNGLLGIDNANKYWQLSYDASKEIIDNGGFALYGVGSSDPEQDYYDLFTRAEMNSETILAEVFDGGESKGNNWERWNAPQAVAGTTFMNTYLETFEMYEYMDGSSGKLDRSTLVEGVFHDMANFIGNKDPRCRANIFLPETTYIGTTIWLHDGMYVNGVYHTENIDGLDVPSKGPSRDTDRTGMFNKKRSNEDYDVGGTQHTAGTDYMIFRLGEIYLNLAEAALALGKDAEALEALNTVRRRVNMPDKPAISWDVIQKERAVELTFEHHRYWDLRRWRIAEQELDRRVSKGNQFTGVEWRKDYSNPGMYEIIHLDSGVASDSWDRIFESHHYYFPITLARTQNSPALIENPGY